MARFVVVQPDDELMSICAGLRASCESAGHPLGQKVHEADRWIASTALRLRVELVSDDGVFQDVEGLVVSSRRGTRAAAPLITALSNPTVACALARLVYEVDVE